MDYYIRIKDYAGDKGMYFNLERGTQVSDPRKATLFKEEYVSELTKRMSAAEPSKPPVEAVPQNIAESEFKKSLRNISSYHSYAEKKKWWEFWK
ncbi:MAG: hypothetical protein K9J84_13605 [Bacteroidia bacterium]|nr:hypothetical protein [Bacteroidia bacterium]